MKKLYFVITALVLAAMLMPACTPTAPDCTLPDVVCVGLVTDVGKVDDKSFNQSSWEALQQAKTEGLVDWVQYIETTDGKDYAKNLATFADEGYDIIVTSGWNLGFATTGTAPLYPNVLFIGVDQPYGDFLAADVEVPANFVGLIYHEDQSGFLVGALGAMMSQTHKLGGVAGADWIPPVWRFGEGYKAGAAYIDAEMGTTTEVTVIYHSDVGIDKTFTDPEWGKITADSMIDQGVDVIFGIGGKTGNGAVEGAAARGVWGIGVDKDQYYELVDAQPYMLTSAMKQITPGVYDLIVLAVEGAFPGGDNFYGVIGYAPYHDLEDQVPDDVKAKMEDILAGLLDGSILTGVSATKPAE
ncbi:MAG: BMP family ABC transporter substrate-binding protein [Chloroflexi bacterium]|nr:BMP family ABC transporter substrate-binding protein [Chloroflexota bacterium]